MNDLLQDIVNRTPDQQIYTGTVESLSPLQIKMYAGDDAINVKCLTSCVGLTIGSNVLMIKFLNKFIIIGVIGNYIPLNNFVQKTSDKVINNTTTFSSDSQLTLSLPPSGLYEVKYSFFIDGVSSTPDVKVKYTYSDITIETYRHIIGSGIDTTSVFNASDIYINAQDLSSEGRYGVTASGWTNIYERFIVSTGSTAGSITPQFAQDVATAEDITIKSQSTGMWTQLNI